MTDLEREARDYLFNSQRFSGDIGVGEADPQKIRFAQAILNGTQSETEAPAGYRLVPVILTPAMAEALENYAIHGERHGRLPQQGWDEVLNAAPPGNPVGEQHIQPAEGRDADGGFGPAVAAPSPLSAARLTEREIEEAFELLRALTDYAYEQGFHECGYDPVMRVRGALEEQRKLTEHWYNHSHTTGWKCFWCNAVFTDGREAERHFGASGSRKPAPECVLSSAAVPEGWKLVPIEPTRAMREAGEDAAVKQYDDSDWEEAKDMAEAIRAEPVWNAMLAAAPEAPRPT